MTDEAVSAYWFSIAVLALALMYHTLKRTP